MYVAVDLALVTQVLPDEDTVAKDLGVFNIAGALPFTVAPAIAHPAREKGQVAPQARRPIGVMGRLAVGCYLNVFTGRMADAARTAQNPRYGV